ncbi:NAD(P)H-hydrate dehydratase [Treponema pectinovorum]|uniref:NAD(P)H-hydrate dehydratase n=1 Tax=Treponema pectinovorum TaxID=164 RepID=UPI003D90FFF8
MQRVFKDTRILDAACQKNFLLSEDVMMENAASALESEIRLNSKNDEKIFVFCGGGNNGADGYALARRISGDYAIKIVQCAKPKSNMCILQFERAKNCGIEFIELENFFNQRIDDFDVAVDCIFGSGFYGDFLDEKGKLIAKALDFINDSNCLKIACDVPTGLRVDGSLASSVFCADLTVTMGAQKLCLYSDFAKDYVGKIKVCNLGISRELFETCTENSNDKIKGNPSKTYLLEEGDLILPHRNKTFVNKGSFGCACIACGKMKGAAIIAAKACFSFGAGLVTIVNRNENSVDENDFSFPSELLISKEIPSKITSLALGMGLGFDEDTIKFYVDFIINNPKIPVVLDADILYSPYITQILEQRPEGCVLTPHPKEFSSLLEICSLGKYSIEECILNRVELAQKFCEKYEGAVLLAKGSNPVICKYSKNEALLFVNTLGSNSLAKGGSGDVLSGLICSLLAQGWDSLDAAKNASLAHSLASTRIKNDFALTPQKLIEKICEL